MWKSLRCGVKKLKSGRNMNGGTRKIDGDRVRWKEWNLSEVQV